MKEILSVHVGQAGIQVGNAVWELLCLDHSLCEEGLSTMNCKESNTEIIFQRVSDNKHVPRSLFVDLEPSVLDEIRTGSYSKLFHPERMISGPEDAANNFARGFFTVGKLVLSKVEGQIRKMFENSDCVQAIILYRSLVGGTGSGLTSAMFEGLAEYPKTSKIELSIYPSPSLTSSTVEPYNCLLAEHFSLEDIGLGMLVDNESLYDSSSRDLYNLTPTYSGINRIMAQIIGNITASIRFQSVATCDITLMLSNLVPFPRIHHPLCNFSPFVGAKSVEFEQATVKDITKNLFERENQFLKVDTYMGKYMSCMLCYRGNINIYDVYEALYEVKCNKVIQFVDWCPTGFKVCISLTPPITIPGEYISETSKNVAMLTNSSAVGQAWQRLTHQFYMLYSKRSFVHWFVGEGIEECEFTESLYNISSLVKDYEEISLPSDSLPDYPLPKEKVSMPAIPIQTSEELIEVPDHFVTMSNGQAISAPDRESLATKSSLVKSGYFKNSVTADIVSELKSMDVDKKLGLPTVEEENPPIADVPLINSKVSDESPAFYAEDGSKEASIV